MFFRTLPLAVALVLPLTASAAYEASSHRADRRDNLYAIGSALDGDFETCWMVDPEQKNEGQWAYIDVPASTVAKLGVVTGWDKDERTFTNYARLKKAKVEIFTREGGEPKLLKETEVTFEDKRGWQVVDLPEVKVGGELHGGRVKLTVLEVYPGRDYPNLALSEMRVHLKEFPAETLRIATEPSSTAHGSAEAMIDKNARTFWAAEGTEATMGFAAPGYGLASIGIRPGPKPHARPKTIEVTANNISTTFELQDKAELQWNLLPVIIGYTGSVWGEVSVRVVDTYPGDRGVAISEVRLNASTIEDF